MLDRIYTGRSYETRDGKFFWIASVNKVGEFTGKEIGSKSQRLFYEDGQSVSWGGSGNITREAWELDMEMD